MCLTIKISDNQKTRFLSAIPTAERQWAMNNTSNVVICHSTGRWELADKEDPQTAYHIKWTEEGGYHIEWNHSSVLRLVECACGHVYYWASPDTPLECPECGNNTASRIL